MDNYEMKEVQGVGWLAPKKRVSPYVIITAAIVGLVAYTAVAGIVFSWLQK